MSAALVRADSAFSSLLSSLSAGLDDDSGDSPRLLFPFPSSARTRLDTSKVYGEAGGISEGGQATAAEDMDDAMAYCGSGGTGAGRRMAEADGKGLLMLTHT